MLAMVAATVSASLLIAWVRKRYIDNDATTCVICGKKFIGRSCPRCGGR